MKGISKYFIAVCLLLSSCSKQELSPAEFAGWVDADKSVLAEMKEVNGIIIELKILPVEYQVIREFGNSINKESYQKKYNELSGLQYYKITFSTTGKIKDMLKHGINNEQDYQKRLYYFSYGMRNDIWLEDNESASSRPALYHFERSFDLTDHTSLIVAFEKKDDIQVEQTLVYNDNTFGIGKIRFKINNDFQEQLPVIKF